MINLSRQGLHINFSFTRRKKVYSRLAQIRTSVHRQRIESSVCFERVENVAGMGANTGSRVFAFIFPLHFQKAISIGSLEFVSIDQ